MGVGWGVIGVTGNVVEGQGFLQLSPMLKKMPLERASVEVMDSPSPSPQSQKTGSARVSIAGSRLYPLRAQLQTSLATSAPGTGSCMTLGCRHPPEGTDSSQGLRNV